MDKNIPLSELIRIGCKASPVQCYGELSRKEDMATCAIGAAHLAKTGELVPAGIETYHTASALLACGVDPDTLVVHPSSDIGKVTILRTIITLNDGFRWSREKISDWLEGIGM